ncbi:hypothetical protein HFP15_35850 [Amycolatopsis sp. K13G38]|uniref:Uncharacterized protein n=1 Tax=Amycolatopsis acididurans TaxID=2724524 RepID=A0ABX1JII5_9PSEU|nr:hypothetical protein [Amycolatopsis acididurans]NKQ58240.1 hypothetical protein [Amycolatopsis acididurans]
MNDLAANDAGSRPAAEPSEATATGTGDVERLRHISAEARRFTDELDRLHARVAAVTSEDVALLRTVLPQAAAAAHDLAVSANHAADVIGQQHDGHTP